MKSHASSRPVPPGPIAKIVTMSGDTTFYKRLMTAFEESRRLRVPHEVQARDVCGNWVLVDTRHPITDEITDAELREISTPLASLVASQPENWRG